MHSEMVPIALVQASCTSDPVENLVKACNKIREAAAQGARIICLQELFLTRYFCQTEDYESFNYAESIPGPSTLVMQELARELEVVLVVSLFEARARGLYHNTAVVIDADGFMSTLQRTSVMAAEDSSWWEKACSRSHAKHCDISSINAAMTGLKRAGPSRWG